MSPTFELTPDRERVAPGEELSATVLVLEGGEARQLELAFELLERSPDYEETASRHVAALHEGDLSAGQSFTATFHLPPDAPPSLRSEHGELFWQLHLRCDEPRGRDEHVRVRIEVAAQAPAG